MLKVQQSNSKLEPMYLLQPKIQQKQIFFLITNSEKNFWMKENLSDWEEVSITEMEHFRDGTQNYYFTGKGYDKIHIPSFLERNETCYLSGGFGLIELEKIPLSKEKLIEIDITNKLELDLSNIPETITDAEKKMSDAEKAKEKAREKDELTPKDLVKLFKKNPDKFFDLLLDKPQAISEPGTSSNNARTDKPLKR